MVVAEQRRLPIESDWKPKTAAGANAAVRKCTVLTLVVLAVFALVMLYTYQTTRIISLGYQADNMQSSVTDLQSRNNQLELEVAELQTPGRVEQIATTKLGMQEPQDFMIVSFSPGQVSSQEAQAKTQAPAGSWAGARLWERMLAAIPGFVGRAEASPSTQ